MKAYNQNIDAADLKLTTDDLRLLIARRADMLTGRQQRGYSWKRAAEILALQGAYSILAAAAHPGEMNISHEHLAEIVSARIVQSGALLAAKIQPCCWKKN